ncbi:Fe-S cluster assembly protein SufD [Salinarimonas soli]|uniref:Fe-S cluster assembly protein SufD n=1 Tax=Salinarimonas soli TaxID=1638099 RepID=A0A5B2V944_9HYPH|nr:Fe-S cluster assembly protein SufD [Salinarimonas soli]KAA2235346.1 Fe-S cluster assembly protein SufD [Salinarimonas soli]
MADIAMIKTAAETGLANLFAITKSLLPGDAAHREDAFRRFSERGLPHRRIEEWKYTDLRALLRDAAPFAGKPTEADIAAAEALDGPLTAIDSIEAVIVNGHLVRAPAALPPGVEIVPLREALGSGHPLLARMGAVGHAHDNAAYALNAAFMSDGAVIRIAAGTHVERPIHLRFLNTGATPFATATRVLVHVEVGASVTLLETHAGPGGVGYQPNGVVEMVVDDHAKVAHMRLNAEGSDALALSTLTARLGAKVAFDSFNLVAGTQVSRHQVYLAFAGEGSNAGIRGATMINGTQHADTTLVIDHAAPGCTSRELFKTVVDGQATGVFQGKIIVHSRAQKTDGRMMSAAVLLSEEGTMNNKPELEIFADDVQCAHGATCGQLDEDLLFYLRSRGLPLKEAEALLLESFLAEPIGEGIVHEDIAAALTGVIDGWLRARG